MVGGCRWAGFAALCGGIALLGATGAGARPARSHTARGELNVHALLHSKALWATINVCNSAGHPNTVGIRGSMPGDGSAHDRMYMSFRLQYMNTTRKAWTDLAKATSPSWVPVGPGAFARQGGFSFTLKPMAGKPAVEMRGVVDFQWRRGNRVRASAALPTTAGHRSVTGADPPGYSSASCLIG